jgi:hypothetical protein
MAEERTLVIDQGATYSNTNIFRDINGDPLILVGTVRAQMRRWYTSINSVTFDTSVNNTMGSVTLELSANTTAALQEGRYVYDVCLINDNTVTRLLEGQVTVTPAVTAII